MLEKKSQEIPNYNASRKERGFNVPIRMVKITSHWVMTVDMGSPNTQMGRRNSWPPTKGMILSSYLPIVLQE